MKPERRFPPQQTGPCPDDGLTYTFTLRESKWNDGTPVTAQDFLFGIQRAVLPSTKSALAEQLFVIKGAKAVNEGTAELSSLGVTAPDEKDAGDYPDGTRRRFSGKNRFHPYMPCNEAFLKKPTAGTGWRWNTFFPTARFSSSGWNHNENLLLNKNEGYADADSILPAAVRYMIGEADDPVTQLKNGLLDAAPIPAGSLDAAREAGLTLTPLEDTIRTLWMNNGNEALKKRPHPPRPADALEWETIAAQLDEAAALAEGYAAPAAVLRRGTLSHRRERPVSGIRQGRGRPWG